MDRAVEAMASRQAIARFSPVYSTVFGKNLVKWSSCSDQLPFSMTSGEKNNRNPALSTSWLFKATYL